MLGNTVGIVNIDMFKGKHCIFRLSYCCCVLSLHTTITITQGPGPMTEACRVIVNIEEFASWKLMGRTKGLDDRFNNG